MATADVYITRINKRFKKNKAATSRCIPVKSTDFGGSLPIFLPSYRQPTDLPQSTDFYRFFRGSTEFFYFFYDTMLMF